MNDAVNTQPVFNMDKIYVKDISLEIPHAPQIFLQQETPQIEVQLHSQANALDEGVYEVVVTTTVTAKLADSKVMFLIEAKQAGIFQVRNVPNDELEPILAVMCPNILFPFLREVVSDVSVRGGFAPVMLTPINFEILYQQQKQQLAQAAPTTTH
ncbi:MAG: protein-export chaperone SecB [Gallionella sp.]|jgi:preprotein translocase subunit SecB|nr:protein-export chaperone SecB [Gallionella sp.]